MRKSPSPPFETEIDIGEIKAYNAKGIKDGHSDLEFYMNKLRTTQAIAGVSPADAVINFLDGPAPGTAGFRRSDLELPGPAAHGREPGRGLYLYSCRHPEAPIPRVDAAVRNSGHPAGGGAASTDAESTA